MGHGRELDPWRHLSIGSDLDAEVDVVGIEVNASWECGDTTKVNLKDTVGNSNRLGFSPQCTTGTGYVVDAVDDGVATVCDIGAVEVNELTLEIDLVVDAGGGMNSIGTRGLEQAKTNSYHGDKRRVRKNVAETFWF